MASSFPNKVNPLLLPEIVGLVMDHVETVPDLLNCACVNSLWNVTALRKLYRGSLTDMQYRTPDIGSLNCLFVASRKRFVQNTSFVKHLLLHPEKPLTLGAGGGLAKIASGETCRALRHRRYAESLLRPEGSGGLLSLTIPFMIFNQNWIPVDDLLISPTLEFLAINLFYCARVILGCTNTLFSSINSKLLRDKLFNLKALTIYNCGGGMDVHHLCEMIACCDLQFFHFDDWKRHPLLPPDITKVLAHLKTQHNLKALALSTKFSSRESRPGTIARAEGWSEVWPNLKALYLGQVDQLRLDEIVKFEELEILSLSDDEGHEDNVYSIEAIAKCRNLRVLDILSRDIDGEEMLLKIARGCPLLQRLSLKLSYGDWFDWMLDSTTFLSLVRALPHLEYLDLSLMVRMQGDWIQHLAVNCPNLTVLRLGQTRLFISLEHSRTAQPFHKLQIMDIKRIFFQDPQSLMEEPDFSILVSEWRRVFPKIRAMPCSDDIQGSQMEKRYQDRLRDGIIDKPRSDSDEEEDDDDEEYDDPGPWLDEYHRRSDWFLLRLKLWEQLHYEQDKAIYDRIADLWQRNFEIEKIGWPVLPLKVFGSDDII